MRRSALDETGGSDNLIEDTVESLAATECLVGESILQTLGEDGDLVETTLGNGNEDEVAAGATKENSVLSPVVLEEGLDGGVPGSDERLPVGVATVLTDIVECVVLEVVDNVVEVRSPGGVVRGTGEGDHGEKRGDEKSEFHF